MLDGSLRSSLCRCLISPDTHGRSHGNISPDSRGPSQLDVWMSIPFNWMYGWVYRSTGCMDGYTVQLDVWMSIPFGNLSKCWGNPGMDGLETHSGGGWGEGGGRGGGQYCALVLESNFKLMRPTVQVQATTWGFGKTGLN